MTSGDRGILLLRCSDRKGVVAAVSGFISDHNGNITSADEHQDQDLNLYFLRLEWTLAEFDVDLKSFESAFTPIARASRFSSPNRATAWPISSTATRSANCRAISGW
jgi:formyltetrahydrofolate hydrolase